MSHSNVSETLSIPVLVGMTNTTASVTAVGSSSTTTTTTTPTATALSEDAIAEQAKKSPFIQMSNRKHQHQHTLSNSSSFDDAIVNIGGDSLLTVVENEYGQLPPGRIHGIHKKGIPPQHRYIGVGGGGNNSSSTNSIGGITSSSVLDGISTTVVSTTGGASTPRSRSRSPSIGRSGGAVAATITTNNTTVPTMMNSVMTDGNSSISSMDDYESDLYTDRAGVIDDLSESQRKLHSSKEFHLPATVLERMSEDSLEDNRAFADLVQQRTSSRSREVVDPGGNFSSNASRVSHVSGTGSNAGDGMLEPLDECDEGLENDSLEDSVTDQNYYNIANPDDIGVTHDASGNPIVDIDANGTDPLLPSTTTVILTNMENLTLESANNELMRQQQGYSSQAGSVSLFESVGGVVVGGGNTSNAATATAGDTTTTVGSISVPPDSMDK
jgi:hypothetical protein